MGLILCPLRYGDAHPIISAFAERNRPKVRPPQRKGRWICASEVYCGPLFVFPDSLTFSVISLNARKIFWLVFQ